MEDFKKQFDRITAQIEQNVSKNIDTALDKAAQRLVEELEKNSPDDPDSAANKYKDGWRINKNYPRKRYVGNAKVVKDSKGKAIPLTNLLEYNGKHERFIRDTYDRMEDELVNIAINELSK